MEEKCFYLVSVQSASDQNKMVEPVLVSDDKLVEFVKEHELGNIIIIKPVDFY
jgi:di/tripeptidase